MSRLIAHRIAEFPNLWNGARAVFQGLSRFFMAAEQDAAGLAELDRERTRIRLQSRHWLM